MFDLTGWFRKLDYKEVTHPTGLRGSPVPMAGYLAKMSLLPLSKMSIEIFNQSWRLVSESDSDYFNLMKHSLVVEGRLEKAA